MVKEYQYQPGDLIAGKYRVSDPLGSGLLADAYRVEYDGQFYALKLPRNQNRDLETEVNILKQLQNCLGVINFVETGILDDGKIYLVTELVDTKACISFLDLKRKKFNLNDFIPHFRAVLEFYNGVHRSGVEYLDAKPEHFLWNPNKKQLWVIDYNLSKIRTKIGPSKSKKRHRWVMTDLRRLSRTVHFTLTNKDVLNYDELPEGSQPLSFPGQDGSYTPFLPTRLPDADQKSIGILGIFIHSLHAGAYPDAKTALEALDTLLSLEEHEGEEQTCKNYLEQQRNAAEKRLTEWNQGRTPDWDEVEESWGWLSEPTIELNDIKDPIAAEIYLWAYAIAEKKANSKNKLGSTIVNLLQSDKPVESNQITIPGSYKHHPAICWLRELRPSIEISQQNEWQNVLASLPEGYPTTKNKLIIYQHKYPGDEKIKSLGRYLDSCQRILRTFSRPDRTKYDDLDVLFDSLENKIPPEKVDTYLCEIRDLKDKHYSARQALYLSVANGNIENGRQKLSELEKLDQHIWNNFRNLLQPEQISDFEYSMARHKINDAISNIENQFKSLDQVLINYTDVSPLDEWQTQYSQATQNLSLTLHLGNGVSDQDSQLKFMNYLKSGHANFREIVEAEKEKIEKLEQDNGKVIQDLKSKIVSTKVEKIEFLIERLLVRSATLKKRNK